MFIIQVEYKIERKESKTRSEDEIKHEKQKMTKKTSENKHNVRGLS